MKINISDGKTSNSDSSNKDASPAECNLVAHWLGRLVMFLTGWKVIGHLPKVPKMVILAAPHTSSWDLLYLLGAAYSWKISIRWFGKNTLFFPILGHVLRFLGGIPIERKHRSQTVSKLKTQISEMEKVTLIVAPAGTRSRTDHWKSGFYRIAKDANIPMVCGYLDYSKKEAGVGPSFIPTGDVKKDMDKIRDFYHPIIGKYPEKTSQVMLIEENSQQGVKS